MPPRPRTRRPAARRCCSSPPCSFTRSRMPDEPVPAAVDARARRPVPVSRTAQRERIGAATRRARSPARRPRACCTLVSASWTIRYARQVEARGQRARLALDLERHRHPRRAGALDQRRELGQPGLRREVGAASSSRSTPSSRRISPSDSSADRRIARQRPARELRVAVERGLGAVGLDRDHAQPVGDDVVQLARDPRPLLGHRELRGPLALVLELGGQRRASLRAGGARRGPASAGSTTAVTAPMYSPVHLVVEPRAAGPTAPRRTP